MNSITLKSCVFNNFMSYGNTANEFTFPNGMVWMCADNGSGKSTLVEAINFALFGTSYRGGNKSELRNTRNVDGTLRVMLEFDCEKGPEDVSTYRITRSISPKGTSKFEVEKMEGGKWVAQSKRAGYSQKDFEESVLGFNEVLFKNDIALNTQESISFIDMPAKQRRELIESILMVLQEPWKKETARRMSAATSAFDLADSDMRRIDGEITNLTRICETLRQEKQDNIEQLESELAVKQAKLAEDTSEYNRLYAECTSKKTEIDTLAAEANRETEVDREIAAIQAAGTEVSMLVRYRSDLDTANTTLKLVTDEYNGMDLVGAQKALSDLDTEIFNATNGKNAADREIVKISTTISNWESRQEEIANQGKNLKPGVPCPMCGKPSTEADIEPHKQELRKQWLGLKKNIDEDKERLVGEQTKSAGFSAEIDRLNAERPAVAGKVDEIKDFYNTKVAPAAADVNRLNAAVQNSERIVKAAGVDPEQFAAEMERLSAEKQKFPEIRQKWQTAYNEYNVLCTKATEVSGLVTTGTGEVTRLVEAIEKAKEKAENDSLAITEQQLESAKSDYADAESRLHKSSDDRLAYEYIGKNMLADDGLKKMILGQFVPAFNESVERNIRRLNLPFSVEFDDSMSFTFRSEPGLAPSYAMLSQGQRRKLGFAISMAFRDFVSMVGNFKINFLSMDEVLDISTDDTAMREMLDIVRDMADEIGCALIITHRGTTVADKFDYRITVENDGIYSTLGGLEKL